MHTSIPQTRDLLFIGGGHAHALVLRQWGMRPLPGVRVTVVNPAPTAPYSGMLPGLIAGHYTQDELEIDLVKLTRFAGARLIQDYVTGIDTSQKLAHFADRPPVAFDIASVDIGITTEIKRLPGSEAFTAPAKPLDVFASRWLTFVDEAKEGNVLPDVTVIGAGVAGVELAMAMAHRLRSALVDTSGLNVSLVERGPQILARASKSLRRHLTRQLAELGVTVLTNANASAATAQGIELENGVTLPSAFTVTAIGANPAPWLEDTGLALHEGFIRVDEQLRSISHEDIFAVGDIAHMDASPRVKAGVFAVRQAPFLYDNLAAVLSGGSLKPYRPQSDYLKLISLGGKSAVATKWGRAIKHPRLWRWKDTIDRTFMDQFKTLPEMDTPEMPTGPLANGVAELMADQPLCGGCGSKVAPSILAASLKVLPEPQRPDILSAPGDDAAILKLDGSIQQILTTDHFRAFTPDPYLLSRIVTTHALNDVWAMGAEPQAVLSSITLPAMSVALQERTLTEILAGIRCALDEAGAELVGGHTSLGAELSLGVTATGLMEGRTPIRLDGARPDDVLILTKPIGTGTLLAAEMQGKANARHIAAIYELMLQSGAGPARALRNDARAMTDITGFGLAGHLQAMMQASGTVAVISLEQIPICDGAIELAEAGIHSSIYPETSKLVGEMEVAAQLLSDPRFKLLFDPQTSGGLLVSIPADCVGVTLKAIRNAGHTAWRIGEVTRLAGKDGLHIEVLA